jgi:hypothetical protein
LWTAPFCLSCENVPRILAILSLPPSLARISREHCAVPAIPNFKICFAKRIFTFLIEILILPYSQELRKSMGSTKDRPSKPQSSFENAKQSEKNGCRYQREACSV